MAHRYKPFFNKSDTTEHFRFLISPTKKQAGKNTTAVEMKQEKNAKVFGTPTQAQLQKRNTLLASNL
jgi:hypothetical protein